MDLFNSLSDNNIKDLIKAFDKIKKGEIKTEDINYNELISYFKNKEEKNELLLLLLNNEKNESRTLFDYLKFRISLMEENLINFININKSLKSEGFFQKIFEQNLIYINDDLRITIFYSLFENMKYSEEYHGRQYEKYITLDRIKSKNFKEKKICDKHLTKSIFGQLFQSLGDLDSKFFLKNKGQNLFNVKLKGESAIDLGGPYREILSDIIEELQSDYIELFIKTGNNFYIINPNANNVNYNKAFEFIGKLMILAISSDETFSFYLHPIIWKSLLENEISFEEYETIDFNFYNTIKKLEEGLIQKDENLINAFDLSFEINFNGKIITLIKNGGETKINLKNVEKFIDLAKSKILEDINNQIKHIKNGLYSGIEKNILKILNRKQLEKMVCGEPVFNIEDFKRHTKCDEKLKEVKWYWEWLDNCKEEDKFKYLKFVSGRSRLPNTDYNHSIIVMKNSDYKLPIAHTCSSELELSEYKYKDLLFKAMDIAINQKEMYIS